MKKRVLLTALLLSTVFTLFGIEFSNLNLSGDDKLLFTTVFESDSAVFISNLDDLSIQQLTILPEKLQLVDNGRSLVAVNRLGAARIPVAGGLPVTLPGYPSFAQGHVPLKGRLQETAISNDGKWLIYLEPTSPAYGNLILVNTSNGAKKTVSERVDLPASDFPAKWSPDSRMFVYEKEGRLFYMPILSDLSVLVDERFRMIGQGGINSIQWGRQGDFFFLTGNTLYRIRNPELFTRTVYGEFLSVGNAAATFSFNFDSGFDRYWISPDSDAVIINKNDKSLFVFLIGSNQNGSMLPHIPIPFGAKNFSILMSGNGGTTSSIAVLFSAQNETKAYRFEINSSGGARTVSHLNARTVPSSSNGALSPDGTRAVFWGTDGLELWDFLNWRLIQKIKEEKVYSCAWINNTRLAVGTKKQIEELTFSSNGIAQKRICLSSVEETGFETAVRGQSRILARNGTDWFVTDGRSPWAAIAEPQLRQTSLATDRYRVYLETQSSGYFKNVPMIRNLSAMGTSSLVARHMASRAYTTGRQTKIALCFDLYDDDTGVALVLNALSRYNIRATFFLNGDFIRRNPVTATAIANAGHETASMFYAPIDFSDSRYRITNEFIARGLARNEDEFFNATGKELSMMWHAPFYRNSELIQSGAWRAGYLTFDRTIDLGDWLSREEAVRLNLRQISPSRMIEQVIEQTVIQGRGRETAVIPVRLGLLPGGRDEYLYQRIDVLLDALVRSGAEVIPVSAIAR